MQASRHRVPEKTGNLSLIHICRWEKGRMVMDKNRTGIKKKVAMAAVLVGAVRSILTFLFIHEVKEELWKQSVQTLSLIHIYHGRPAHGGRGAEARGHCRLH